MFWPSCEGARSGPLKPPLLSANETRRAARVIAFSNRGAPMRLSTRRAPPGSRSASRAARSSRGAPARRRACAGAGTAPPGCRRACAAGPLVIITMRSERNSASSTSWVTISAVLRSAATVSSSTSCSSKRVSESSMPNGSSSSSTLGSSANARAMPTRWRMPADSSRRLLVHRVAQADRARGSASTISVALCARRVRLDLLDAEHHVLERGHPRQQARRLEHDAAIGPGPGDLACRRPARRPRSAAAGRRPSTAPSTCRSRMADQADELALARSARSKSLHDDRLAAVGRRDSVFVRCENLQVAFVDGFMPPPRCRQPACAARRPHSPGDAGGGRRHCRAVARSQQIFDDLVAHRLEARVVVHRLAVARPRDRHRDRRARASRPGPRSAG